MRQKVGLLFIICSFPLLYIIGNKIWGEVNVATAYTKQIEELIEFPEVNHRLPVKILDQNGVLFHEEYVEWREPVRLENVPEIIQQIFILSEDRDFYQHIGFDVSAIVRALATNSSQNSIQQGASTITQQLVRMLYLSEEKTYERKLMEVFYAHKLEQMYDKATILEKYLNEMYFSNQVYGISSAATFYFQKPLEELSVAEAAFISAIPNNPSLYDPLRNFDNTKARQERLIDVLVLNELITNEEATQYKQENIQLHIKDKIEKFPAYSTYVFHELKELVSKSEGFDDAMNHSTSTEEKKNLEEKLHNKINELLSSGIIIHTALHPSKQEKNEQTINSLLSVNDLQSSAVVIDNETREIISIYGGKNYKKYNFHRAYQAPRQPGSSFKPLIVYAPLFETTYYTPSSTVSGGKFCVGNFCPQNYGGAIYGNVPISTAFIHSFNTSAVRLLTQVGIETAFSYLEPFEFKHIIEKDYNYASALGGLTYGVTALEMAGAYTSFIDGMYVTPHSIRKVTDLDGNILYSWEDDRIQVWSSHTVTYIRSLLNEVVKKGTGRGIHSNSTYIGAKTGTTNNYRDFWLTGLSNEYTVAVWIGFDQPKSMHWLERDQIHFKIFNRIMND